MVFDRNEQSFADHMSDQFAYEHTRHLAHDDRLSPFTEDSPYETIPAKLPASDEELKGFASYHKDFDNVTADPPYDDFHSGLCGNHGVSWVTGNNSEVIWTGNGKRPLYDDEICLYASKRLKQVEQNLQLGSFEEVHFSTCEESPSVAAEDLKDRGIASVPEDLANQATTSHWFARSTSREAGLDPPVWAPSYPSYFGDTCQAVEFDQVEEIHFPVFDYFNRKHVSIGPNHQADIPELRPRELKNHIEDYASPSTPVTGSPSCNDLRVDEDDCDKWFGTRAMPMPDSALLASDVLVLCRKIDCRCPDEGSIRCVRQHVIEAREKLKQNLGQDRFVELGFGDMGEVVAQKWTAGEEQLFHEVVLSNPASLGKNFWSKLPHVFPARSSKELVSYYFNVYMLQKRAEQNRLDPLHADSDNDEWEESDDGEFAMEEEEEDDDDEDDSVVESPLADQFDVAGEEDELDNEEISEEADDVEDCHYYSLARNNEIGACGDVKVMSESNLLSGMQFMGSNLHHYVEEQDIQDDSCTSYEGQHNGADSYEPVDDIFDLKHGLIQDHENFCENDGLSGLTDTGFFNEQCDPKAWDMNYGCGAEKDDLLSTCNVIEEVFGKEPWEK